MAAFPGTSELGGARAGERIQASSGLTTQEASERLALYGPNVIDENNRESFIIRIARRLAEPLIAILLLSGLTSGLMGDWKSFIIIVLIVAVSMVLDMVQEHKASAAIEALKRSVALTANVVRDGRDLVVPVSEVVPGDVVRLTPGDLVPADGYVLQSHAALANEATLTGEPYPAEKKPVDPGQDETRDRAGLLFAGTSLVNGEASMVVTATGKNSVFGSIAKTVQARHSVTAFELGLQRLGWLIIRLTGFLVLFVLLVQLARQGLSLQSFTFAIALAVGLTPELLPMIMTITLARGAVRMAARRVIVKRLSAIHDLGAMNVLCTDKTGTLTDAKIALVECVDADGAQSRAVAHYLFLNSHFASGMRNNLDDAILANPERVEGWSRIDDIPFDFERRRVSVCLSGASRRVLLTKGAPEAVLALSTRVALANGDFVEIDDEIRAKIEKLVCDKGERGLRLIGIAMRDVPAEQTSVCEDDENDLIFLGCGVFLDPPKASVKEAAQRLIKAGVGLKIVSGDSGPVVLHLVKSLGLPSQGVLTGDEIAILSEQALAAKVAENDLFVRTTPQQKERIVRALRSRGLCVGFLGDGINDAAAIHVADVGISVESGTDVAREAADIILLAPDLGVLADGVAEGRRTYANIMKYVRMATSSNFGNMLSMALASVFLPFLPLLPLQILLNNLLYDISEIGIPFDTADDAAVEHPQSWNTRAVLGFTLIMGPLSSIFDLATFALLLLVVKADPAVFRTAWFVESIATQILVIFVIRTTRHFWQSAPNEFLLLTSLGALGIALAIALTPIGVFVDFAGLSAPLLVMIGFICAAYLAAAEFLKPVAFSWMPTLNLKRRIFPWR